MVGPLVELCAALDMLAALGNNGLPPGGPPMGGIIPGGIGPPMYGGAIPMGNIIPPGPPPGIIPPWGGPGAGGFFLCGGSSSLSGDCDLLPLFLFPCICLSCSFASSSGIPSMP
uniref:Uncharacterized protein n=1 Tax=Cacopsylla melanoneura TaxID=428564 RepID=A0A8D8RTW0_9HEMI